MLLAGHRAGWSVKAVPMSIRGYRGMKDTTSVGDLSEFEVATALMRTRKRVLRPLSAGLRYDLAIDNGDGTVVRVQCKTGILRNGFHVPRLQR
jgi:hypothetical protein